MTREEAIKAIDHLMYSSPHEATEQIVKKKYYAELLKEYIEDAVDVVRCGECRFNNDADLMGCPMVRLHHNPDDYCSRGERKTE